MVLYTPIGVLLPDFTFKQFGTCPESGRKFGIVVPEPAPSSIRKWDKSGEWHFPIEQKRRVDFVPPRSTLI